jgi:choline dehydrogenase-like flavoprotein
MPEHYDVIVVGTGAGGGTLAHTLAPSGKRILLLERGDFLPREMQNWDPGAVFVDGRYISEDRWYDPAGTPFQPQVHYYVGGATKLYGAALYRLRPQDFEELKHVDGMSPAWPLSYDDFEPYYTKAEWLYQVHGHHGDDPTEGPWSKQYPWPAVSHEPRIQQLSDDLQAGGYHPFSAPCGVLLDEAERARSACIRCTWCDGYPCLVHAKSDAETIAVRPALEHPNVSLLVNAEVVQLTTNPAGTSVTSVVVARGNARDEYTADIVVLSAGAANSA